MNRTFALGAFDVPALLAVVLLAFLAAGVVAVLAWRVQQRTAVVGGAALATLMAGALFLAVTAPDPRRLPTWTLRASHGEDVALAAFAGKPVVLNLWATWCGPCLREMPLLQQAQAARPDLHFVFLNQGEPATKVRAYLSARGMRLRNVLLDERGAMGRLTGEKALPLTYFYDANGKLVDTHVGELSPERLQERLALLARPGAVSAR